MVRVVPNTLNKVSSDQLVVNKMAMFEVFIEYEVQDIKCMSDSQIEEEIAVYVGESPNIRIGDFYDVINTIGICDNFGIGPGCGGVLCTPIGCLAFCFPVQFPWTFSEAMDSGYMTVMEEMCPTKSACLADMTKRAVKAISVAPEPEEGKCHLTIDVVKLPPNIYANIYINGAYAGRDSYCYTGLYGEMIDIEISGPDIKTQKIDSFVIPSKSYESLNIEVSTCDIFCKIGEYVPYIIMGGVIILGGYLVYRYYTKSKTRSELIESARIEEERRRRREEAEEARMRRFEELMILGARR